MTVSRFLPGVFAVALLLGPGVTYGEVQVAGVFSDHMVLQRSKPLVVWGWAGSGEKVTVTFAPRQGSGQADQTKSARAGADGKWRVVLDPLDASAKPATLTVAGSSTVTFQDVLVGDVWIFSGQSNMGRNVGRHPTPPGMKFDEPLIRYWGAGKDQKYPIERFDPPARPWVVCDGRGVHQRLLRGGLLLRPIPARPRREGADRHRLAGVGGQHHPGVDSAVRLPHGPGPEGPRRAMRRSITRTPSTAGRSGGSGWRRSRSGSTRPTTRSPRPSRSRIPSRECPSRSPATCAGSSTARSIPSRAWRSRAWCGTRARATAATSSGTSS